MRKNGSWITTVAVLGTIALVSLALQAPAAPDSDSDSDRGSGFSTADLRGSLGCNLSGELLDGSLVGPVVGVGVATFDGNGGVDLTRTLNAAGVVTLQQIGSGTYQLGSDGTGTAEVLVTTVDPPGFPDATETFAILISDNANRGEFAATTPGAVAVGSCVKQ